MSEESFNPASLSRSDTFSSTIPAGKTLPNISTKSLKTGAGFPRIDYEPLYADLKAAIGHHWTTYYDTLTRFIRGELSATEFGDLTDSFILVNQATEHAHNNLVCAIVFNSARDPPEPGSAAWVSAASDKAGNASTAKAAVTSDAGEQRLKAEIMSIPARDRRRIKTFSASDKPDDDATTAALPRNPYEDYQRAMKIRAPESNPTITTTTSSSTSSNLKTNLDLEIKKRYLQPLASETLEFPDPPTIYARIVPLCYEESLPQGSTLQAAELIAIAAETHMKLLLSTVFNATRSNAAKYESGGGDGGIQTASYRRKLQLEETDLKSGKIQKISGSALLPIELRQANSRKPIGMTDLQTASKVVPGLWNGMKLIGVQIAEAAFDTEQEEWRAERPPEMVGRVDGGDPMDLGTEDNDDYGWTGSSTGDRMALDAVLEECLAIRA